MSKFGAGRARPMLSVRKLAPNRPPQQPLSKLRFSSPRLLFVPPLTPGSAPSAVITGRKISCSFCPSRSRTILRSNRFFAPLPVLPSTDFAPPDSTFSTTFSTFIPTASIPGKTSVPSPPATFRFLKDCWLRSFCSPWQSESAFFSTPNSPLPCLDILRLPCSTRSISRRSPCSTSSFFLAFSLFFFLSLAMAKRYSELLHASDLVTAGTSGRGYHAGDRELLLALGTGSSFAAVVIFSLYVHSPEVRLLYASPEFLFLLCPIVLYWLSRNWLL